MESPFTMKTMSSSPVMANPFKLESRTHKDQANIVSLCGKKVQDVFTTVYDACKTIFTDQTKHFSTQSQCGNKYVMVTAKIDSNVICLEPLKSRKDSEFIHRYEALIKHLLCAGVTPKKHVLDNEISQHMKDHIKDNCHFTLELVPPGCHHCNAAKCPCRYCGLFSSQSVGPPSAPDKIMLNLQHQSNVMPIISAYAHLSVLFEYNKMPLAPMDCKVQVYEKTYKQDTRAFHCINT
ncbi:hypothetical protein ACHAW6_011734 [Cyclotella cf. meneghiniana]